jgi:hypothetical protein
MKTMKLRLLAFGQIMQTFRSGTGTRSGTSWLPILTVVLLVVPAYAFAGIKLRPEPQLIAYSQHGKFSEAAELLASRSFDQKYLGRVLHKTLQRNTSASSERTVFVEKLISAGADLAYAGAEKTTALLHAIKQLDEPLIKLLLLYGSDPAAKDISGKDAASYAVLLQGENGAISQLLKNPPKAKNRPEIKNIELKLKHGDVLISYDLIGSDAACVNLSGSLDGGKNYKMKFDHASGDIGENVVPGKGKLIVWKSKSDYPAGLQNADIVLDVVAKACDTASINTKGSRR